MRNISTAIFTILIGFLFIDKTYAKGIIPDRVNQVIIYSNLPEQSPTFYLIFSSRPIPSSLKRSALQSLIANRDRKDILVLKMYDKKQTKSGRFDYFFGTKFDPNCPWNNGTDFHWQDWANYSDDIWDNIAIAYEPPTDSIKKLPVIINHIAIRRGGQLLLDSRAKQTYPNKHKFSINLPKKNILPSKEHYILLCLGNVMTQFRNQYYELKGDILKTAYSDLGQTDKNKYAKRGSAWCSELASYVYRTNGLDTPDPDAIDVHWKNLREYFVKSGHIYTIREVATWPDDKKVKLISPGSIVSILTDEERSTTHTIIFNSWIKSENEPIESYTGISGCNKGMVWAHAPLFLPPTDWADNKTEEKILNYDTKCFFGVPKQINEKTTQVSSSSFSRIQQLPPTERVNECLRILNSMSLPKDT